MDLKEKRVCAEYHGLRLSALGLAVCVDAPEIAAILIETGRCEINDDDNASPWPLFLAVEAQNERTTALLIRAGADVNHSNVNYGSALDLAVRQQNEMIVRLLVDAVVDVVHVFSSSMAPVCMPSAA